MATRKLFYTGAIGLCSVGFYCLGSARSDTDRKIMSFPRVLAKSLPQTNTSKVDENELELLLVQVVFRHGARTPIRFIPGIEQANWDKDVFLKTLAHTDISYQVRNTNGEERTLSGLDDYYKTKIFRGGSAFGQLTILGQEQMFQLGKELGKEYIERLGLVDSCFNPHQVYLRTSNIERTIQSLRCLVSGMYSEDNLKDPVTFFTVPLNSEIIYPNMYSCKHLGSLFGIWMGQLNHANMFTKFCGTLSSELNVSVDSVDIFGIFDNIVARKAHNLPVPGCLEPHMEELERIASVIQMGFIEDKHLRKHIIQLGIGKCWELITKEMEDVIGNRSPHKMCLYSAHDTSLIALLAALDIKVKQWPPFASHLIIELYRSKEKEHFVKVKYRNEVLEVPKCSGVYCPLKEFEEAVGRFRVDDWQMACQQEVGNVSFNVDVCTSSQSS